MIDAAERFVAALNSIKPLGIAVLALTVAILPVIVISAIAVRYTFF